MRLPEAVRHKSHTEPPPTRHGGEDERGRRLRLGVRRRGGERGRARAETPVVRANRRPGRVRAEPADQIPHQIAGRRRSSRSEPQPARRGGDVVHERRRGIFLRSSRGCGVQGLDRSLPARGARGRWRRADGGASRRCRGVWVRPGRHANVARVRGQRVPAHDRPQGRRAPRVNVTLRRGRGRPGQSAHREGIRG